MIVAPDKRDTIIELGLGVAAAGGVLVVAYAITRSAVVNQLDGPEEQAAARGVWDAFLGDLRTEAWILAGAGAVIAAAASSLIKPLPFGEPIRVAAAWIAREPRSPHPEGAARRRVHRGRRVRARGPERRARRWCSTRSAST